MSSKTKSSSLNPYTPSDNIIKMTIKNFTWVQQV